MVSSTGVIEVLVLVAILVISLERPIELRKVSKGLIGTLYV